MLKPVVAAVLMALGLLGGTAAWAQANLKPDPVPRVQPPGMQALPAEDREFIKTALALSRVETHIGTIAEERAQEPQVAELAKSIAAEHERLAHGLQRLAEIYGVSVEHADPLVPDQGGPGGAASAVTNPEHAPGGVSVDVMRQLSQVPPEQFGPAFAEGQLAIHDRLVDLYQTQAGNTPVRELAVFAITNLVEIQKHRDAVQRLAAGYGVAVDPQKGQPLQYRNGSSQ